jgi:hypothetical protein
MGQKGPSFCGVANGIFARAVVNLADQFLAGVVITSAFGGKADIDRTSAMSAYDPKRTSAL